MRRPLLVLALLACGACRRGQVEEPPRQQVVIQQARPRNSRPPKQPPEWFDARIAEAMELEREGRFAEAFARVAEVRSQRPDEATEARLQELILRINRQVLEVSTLSAMVEPARDPISFGDTLRVRFRLYNDTAAAIRIPARTRGGSRSIFVIDVVRREYDTRAQVVSNRRVVHRPLDADLEVPAGGATELVLDLGLFGNDRPLAGFRVFTIAASLRPIVQEVGGVRRWEAIRIEPATLRSFRANWEHLADDPVRRVGQAIEKHAGVHLLTAGALVPADRRTEAVDTMVAALRGDRPIDWALFATLQYLTDIELGRDAQAWKSWWARVRDNFFSTPAQPTGDGPAFR